MALRLLVVVSTLALCTLPPAVAAAPARAQQAPVCDDEIDNDADGLIDGDDPGCRGDPSGTSEADPPPVPSTFRFTSVRVNACGIDTAVEVLPDLCR